MVSQTVRLVAKSIPLSERAQRGYEEIQAGRFRKKPQWNAELTVLDKATAKLPLVKRRALAIKKQFAEMPLDIMDYELVVGSVVDHAPLPRYWTDEELEAAHQKYTTPGVIDGAGHYCASYPRFLKLGVGGLRKLAEEKLEKARQDGASGEVEAWYGSVMISLDGLANFIMRYSTFASVRAESETDSVRKQELEEIAAIALHLSEEPPRTFREAVQAFWFARIALSSTSSGGNSTGRMDQYLWPFLEKDMASATITIEQAQELMDLLWLKFNEQLQNVNVLDTTSHKSVYVGHSAVDADMSTRNFWTGQWGHHLGGKTSNDRQYTGAEQYNIFGHTVTVSGLTPEGEDGTNLVTYLCLNASLRLGVVVPELYVRLHDESPPELYERAADVHRAGVGGPSIYNDEVIIPALERWGFSTEHARDYNSDACWEIYSQGRTNFSYGCISLVEAVDRVLHWAKWDEEVDTPFYKEEWDPFRDLQPADPYGFSSFNEVMEAFKVNFDRLLRGFVESTDEMRDGRLYKIAPNPLLSAMTEGPLESGKDVTQDGVTYLVRTPLLTGLSHAADSLAAIKKLCFEEKLIGWPELLDAVRSNWHGKENLRQLAMTRAPAYGNDIDYVDDIAREITEYYLERLRKHGANIKNEKLTLWPGLGTFAFYRSHGEMAGATADGRLAGQWISSNASPSTGRAENGPTAAVNSYCKLPLVDMPCGAPLDIAMESRASLISQLETFFRSFIEKRGELLTLSINDCEKLRAAQQAPEKHRDLKIRVGGWNVYFVDLPPEMQDWQIKKCETYSGA